VAAKRAKAAEGRKPPEPAKGKSNFNEDEANVEFSRGGAVRGAGMTRARKARYI
jgi:hypothetical protein